MFILGLRPRAKIIDVTYFRRESSLSCCLPNWNKQMIYHKWIWINFLHMTSEFVFHIIQIVVFFMMPNFRGRTTNNTSYRAPPTAHARPLAQLSRELCSHVPMPPTHFHIVNRTSDRAQPPYINFPIKLDEWSLYSDAVCIPPFFFISKCGAIIQAC